MAGLLDYLEALGETGAMLGTGAASGMVGMPYGVYKGIRSGKYGTPEGVRIAEEEARRFMERNTYQPRSQMAQNALSYAGGLLSDARIPPIIPEAAALSAIPLRPAARMAGEGVAATGRFVAPKAGQLAEQYMVNTGAILPLDVYHGSPHIFPPTPRNPLGEFDASKINTGEGAQAYGHGIYVAEAPGVATDYAKKLGPSTAMQSSQDIRERMGRFADAIAQRYKPDAISPIQDVLLNPDKYPQRVVNATKKISEAEDAAYLKATKGNLYKVDLPDKQIAKMLDWDKPLSQQPNILKVLEKNYRSDYLDMFRNLPGSDFYKAISGNEGIEDLRVLGSSELTKIGIPGIKYLDATSRSAGKGTRNFVVFPGEEKSMTILERNGQRAEELKRLQAGGLLAP